MCSNNFIGCPCNVEMLAQHVDKLNLKVVEQLNDSQELVMINNYVQETNERLFLNSLKERVSEIGAWHWVLQDLLKRMDDAIVALQYERNAVNVVIQRLNDEIRRRSLEGCRPGALCPRTDSVEKAITQEFFFLKSERKKFEEMACEIDKQILFLEMVKKRIQNDILKKEEALNIEEECGKIKKATAQCYCKIEKQKKKRTPVEKWLYNCKKLKETGLNALRNAVTIRQQIRGARVQLSIGAQSFGARVDALLRKRLHTNTAKLEEISFQIDEAHGDLRALDEEKATAEKSIYETMDQEQIVIRRMEERAQRPGRELTSDDVDRNLRGELASLRHFRKQLQDNVFRINGLKEQLVNAVNRFDDYAHDILEVMHLDQHRIQSRMDDANPSDPVNSKAASGESNTSRAPQKIARDAPTESSHENEQGEIAPTLLPLLSTISNTRGTLHSIQEEDEMNAADDYPVDF